MTKRYLVEKRYNPCGAFFHDIIEADSYDDAQKICRSMSGVFCKMDGVDTILNYEYVGEVVDGDFVKMPLEWFLHFVGNARR